MKKLLPVIGTLGILGFSASTSFAATYYSFDTSIHPQALCADGTTAGMWVEPGSNDQQWVVHLLDGGACYDGETCRTQRNNPNLRGRSLFSSAEINPPGPAPHNPASMNHNGRQVGDLHLTGIWAAPTLTDAWIVVVNYCSQDHMAGSNKHFYPELADPSWANSGDFPTSVEFIPSPPFFRLTNLRFYGRHIMDAALGALVDGDPVYDETNSGWVAPNFFPFPGATDVVLAASSAGTGSYAFNGHETVAKLAQAADPIADYRFVFDGNFDLVARPPNWDVNINSNCSIDPTLTFSECDRAKGIVAAAAWDSQGNYYPDQSCLNNNPVDDTICYRVSHYVDELSSSYPLFTRAAMYDNVATPIYAYPEPAWLSPPANPTPTNVDSWYTSTFQSEFVARLSGGYLNAGPQHVTIRNGVCNGINIPVDPVAPFPVVRNCRTEIGRFVGPKNPIFSIDNTLP